MRVSCKKQKIYINARFMTQNTTGVQRYSQELIKALDMLIDRGDIDRSKYDIVLLAPQKNIKVHLGLRHITLRKCGALSGHLWEQLELPLHSKDGLLFCPGNTAPILSLLTGKTVVTVHSLSFLYFPEAYRPLFIWYYRLIIPMVLRYSDMVITVSETEKEIIQRKYHFANKICVVQNGGLAGDQVVSGIREDQLETKPYILFVGSLSKGKNLQGVLDALVFLDKEDIRLKVVGADGATFNDVQINMPKNISDKVEFLGQIDNQQSIIHLYKDALCLIFPSFYESSGLPPIEAMSCGCPVIASTSPALLERCGDAALYCDPKNPRDIADKIVLLLNNKKLWQELSQKGFVRSKKFSWHKSAKNVFSVFNSLIKQRENKEI